MSSSKLLLPFVLAAAFAVPASASADVTLTPVDGGAGYYDGFSHALSTSPGHFPVGVWFESVIDEGDVAKDKGVGLNTYVVLTGNSDLGLVRNRGMRALLHHGEHASSPAVGSETAGWELEDEIDMQMSPDEGYAELERIKAGLPADGRLRYNNFGKGVMFWETDAEAARYVNAVDLPSNDIYWFTDPHVCGVSEGGKMFAGGTRSLTEAECRRASNYGAVVDRMRALVSPARSKPVWAFIEVGHPFTEDDAPTIQGPQIRAAVWHSLIAGARGLLYFNHNFGGPCQSQHVLRDECGAAVRPTVRAVNDQIKRLAPVLNAPFANGVVSTAAAVRTMVKYNGGQFYVFAGNRENGARDATFELPSCLGGARVAVLDENRTIPITGGRFADSFADGNAVHIYRVDGGTTCGLPIDAGGTPAAPIPGFGSAPGEAGRRALIGRLPRRLPRRARRVRVPVTCVTTCSAKSRLTTRRRGRRVLLASARRRFGPGRHRLVLRLTKRDRRRVAGGRPMRLRTVLVDSGVTVRRTQRLVLRRR